MINRRLLLLSAILILLGEVMYQIAQYFHAEGGTTPSEVFITYAKSSSWTLVHEAQFAGSTIFIFGILLLIYNLKDGSRIQGIVNLFASTLAIATLAINGVLYAVDGVALREAINSWIRVSPSQQFAYFAMVLGIRGIEWGLRSYLDFTTGLTLILLAIVIASGVKIFRVIGYIMGLSGLAYIVQGYGYGRGYTPISEHFVLGSINYQFLIFIWAILMVIITLRMKEPEVYSPHETSSA